jgi:pimeloyl-ACP methyl ester carboxylesterase
MYIQCWGSGSPTVVLISGKGYAGDLWDSPETKGSPRVFPQVSKTTRVCNYDRPGTVHQGEDPQPPYNGSTPVPQPTTTQSAVSDLNALLGAAHVPGPYVLAAHSYGGAIARLYAHTYPAQVTGMVLIDSFGPELRAKFTAQQWKTWGTLNATPAAALKAYPASEQLNNDVALDQVETARSIPPMPLVVLAADQDYGTQVEQMAAEGKLPAGVPADFGYLIFRYGLQAQAQIANLVPGAKLVTKTNSGHDIMLDNPTLVTSSIVEVINAERQGRTSVNT